MADIQTNLQIDQLQANPFQPREKIKKEELSELISSVKTYGILEPLVVAQTPAGYQIIAGERRWRAAREAGLTEVPVLVKKTTPKGMLEMALVENVQRSNLSPLERAQAFKQLMREFDLQLKEISERVGKSTSYISNTVNLLNLPDAIKDGLVSKEITEGHARALNGIENEADQIECFKMILKERASVRRAEELSRMFKEKSKLATKKTAGQGNAQTYQIPKEQIQKWQKQMQKNFNPKSRLQLSRSKSVTRVTIKLHGALEKTQDDLEKIISFLTQKHS